MALTVPWERVEGFPGSTKMGVSASPLLPAPVSCHNHGCCCLACGWCQHSPMSLGTGLAVCPVQPLAAAPRTGSAQGWDCFWELLLGHFAAMSYPAVCSSLPSSPGSGYYLESHTNEVYAEEPPPEPALDYRRGNSTQPILCVPVGNPRHGRLPRHLPALPQCPSGAPRSTSTAERPPATPHGAARTAAAWAHAAS